jgi:hypothetical protein
MVEPNTTARKQGQWPGLRVPAREEEAESFQATKLEESKRRRKQSWDSTEPRPSEKTDLGRGSVCHETKHTRLPGARDPAGKPVPAACLGKSIRTETLRSAHEDKARGRHNESLKQQIRCVNDEGKSTPEHEFWPAENKSVRTEQEEILTRKIKLNLVEARPANRLVAGS